MKRKHLERAAWLAVGLAEEAAARLPACCPVTLQDVYVVVFPLAVRLERLERRARKNRKRAKAHRRAVREARRTVAALLASQPEALASVPALAQSVPFRPELWRVDLVPGFPVHAAEKEAA